MLVVHAVLEFKVLFTLLLFMIQNTITECKMDLAQTFRLLGVCHYLTEEHHFTEGPI